MASKYFKKTKENFSCEHCGTVVQGNGYTNHCPHCLWSKHVDIYPGDRSQSCAGMMKPTRVDLEKREYIVTQECQKCFTVRRNKLAPNDNFDEVIAIQKRFVEKQSIA